MWQQWPFFNTRIAMLEMVYAKADLWLAEYYDHRLVEERLWPLGQNCVTSYLKILKACWRFQR